MMKKPLSLLMVIAVMICMVGVVSADGGVNITINNGNAGAVYHGYKLLSLSTSLACKEVAHTAPEDHDDACYAHGYTFDDYRYMYVTASGLLKIDEHAFDAYIMTLIADMDPGERQDHINGIADGLDLMELFVMLDALGVEPEGLGPVIIKLIAELGASEIQQFANAAFSFILEINEMLSENEEELLLPNIVTDPNATDPDQPNVFYDVEQGYYLIVETKDGDPIDEDSAYSLVMLDTAGRNDVEINSKNDAPVVEKGVWDKANAEFSDSITAGIGDELYFEITGTVPNTYSGYDTYAFRFTDTLSKGLSLGAVPYIFVEREGLVGPYQMDWFPYPSIEDDLDDPFALGFYVEEPTVLKPTTELFIGLGDLKERTIFGLSGDDAKIKPGDKIIVRYSVLLNEDAVIGAGDDGKGNYNSVFIEYSRDPNGDEIGKTLPDEVYVYTFEIEVIKTDGDEQVLEGAVFILSRIKEQPQANQVQQPFPLTVNMSIINIPSGFFQEYLLVDANNKVNSWTRIRTEALTPLAQSLNDPKNTGLLVSGVDGKINVYGLPAGTYYLEEIQAPAGYNLLPEAIKIVITPTYDEDDGTLVELDFTYEDEAGEADIEDGVISFEVENRAGMELPETGGMGTLMIYVVGGLLALVAVVLLVSYKRRPSMDKVS